MECLHVVCPAGQFSTPAHCDAEAFCIRDGGAVPHHHHQAGSQLLEQLQDCNNRAQQLLTLLSIYREQGIAAYAAGVERLFTEALQCILHALQTAAAAKQPLLTTSSQHSSCFCKLLERLHLLDALWKASNPGPTPGVQQDGAVQQPGCGEIEPATIPELVQCPSLPFINQLEAKLRGISGLDAVLAALIAHAQQNAAGGSKLSPGALNPNSSKQEVLEVTSLSAVQEQHSSARALPLLIRLYFNTGSRAETIAAGKPEPLTAKLLERSLAVLAAKPVVPGCADVPVCLTSGLQACQGLSELAAARKLKLPTELGKLDFKAAFKLDQSYSLQDKVLPLLQQHDELCDLLSQLALEIQQAMAVERDIDPKALDGVEQLVAGSINFAAAAKNSLLDLDAWRLSTCGAGTDSATPTSARTCPEQCLEGFPLGGSGTDSNCDRYKLKDDDVVPFIDVLGAIKGLTGLLADSSSWLQPLLHEHAVRQLNEFAFFTLPALSKLYSRNPRLQDLLRAIYACMQGQFVEVGEDVDAAAVPSAAAAEAALSALASDSQLAQQAGRPLAEGFEGFKERWGKKSATQKHAAQQGASKAAAAAKAEGPGGEGAATAAVEQQAACAEPVEPVQDGTTGGGAVAAASAAAAADVEAATAAASAAAAALSASSSPRSVSEVDVCEQQLAVVQTATAAEPPCSSAADSKAADPAATPAEGLQKAAAAASHAAAAEEAEVLAVSAAVAASASVQPSVPAGQASRKRTLKGLFKFKNHGRRKDKAAAAVAGDGPAEAPQQAAAAAAEHTPAAAAPAAAAAADDEPSMPMASEAQQKPHQEAASAPAAQQQQQPPCAAFAWTDSENDMLLCHIRSQEANMVPSGASSMADLNSAGFERPPDLPWELQASISDDSPRSVARAAAMFERIAAVNRQLAAASGPRLSSAGRAAAGGSRSSPGGWEGSASSSTGFPARLTEVGGSPLSKDQLRQVAQAAAEELGDGASMNADEQQCPSGASSPAKAGQSRRRQGLFGFRSLLPQRAASEPQQEYHQPGSQDEDAEAAAEHKQLQVQQQEKEQLAEQLQDKHEVALLSGQELEDLMQVPPEDAAIPASWGAAVPTSPMDGKQRMKSVLSMLRRGSARAASTGAATALQAGGIPVEAVAEQQLVAAELGAVAAEGAVGAAEQDIGASQNGSQPDASEDFDEDQPSKTRRVMGMGIMNRIRVFTQGSKEQQAQQAVAQQHAQPVGDAAGSRQGLKGLKFTAKLKKAMGDRRQSRFADAVGVDGQSQLPLEAMPSAACLLLLRVLLELLMHEIKAETKKHLMMQLQMAAAAAAGSAGVSKPDASIARPLKQVKQMIKAVHRMQLMVDFQKQLLAAADLSDLWVGASCGSSLAALAVATQQAAPSDDCSTGTWQTPRGGSKQQQQQPPQPAPEGHKAVNPDLSPPSPKGLHPWSLYNLLFEENSESSLNEAVRNSLGALSHSKSVRIHEAADSTGLGLASAASHDGPVSNISIPGPPLHLSSFPAALMSACMQQLERVPAELPLLALQVLWDARRLLNSCGLLNQGLVLLQQQEKVCMACYMQQVVPMAYEHFKRLAGHQVITTELLNSCTAKPLLPVKPLYLDSLLREPCPLVMQADYAAIAAEAATALHPGPLAAMDAQLAGTLQGLADVVQELKQHKAVDQIQQAVRDVQQAEADLQLGSEGLQSGLVSQERPVSDQQEPADTRFSGVFTAAKAPCGKSPTLQAAATATSSPSPGRAGRKKRQGRTSKHRSSGAGTTAAAAAAAGPSVGGSNGSGTEQPAGLTPLMHKLEGMQAVHEAEAAAGRVSMQRCLQAWGACELDVRQWLLAGMVEALQQDAAIVVARCSGECATSLVESQAHACVLQRTHALLAQYTPLPLSWEQLWQHANTQQQEDQAEGGAGDSRTAAATIAGLLRLLDTAVYDAEAQVLLPVAEGAAAGAGDAVPGVVGVLAELEAALLPLKAFFGRQHLAALHAFLGPLGVQQLISAVLQKLDTEQKLLMEQLLSLQRQLPNALLRLPAAEQYHSAGAVLQFYQQQLSSALEDHRACAAALSTLQRIGNCLALLHLLSIQQAVQATPTFMQVAPQLGIVGRPITDAAAAAECFEGEEFPAPPSALASAAVQSSGCHNLAKACIPGLLMPDIEMLVPSDHTRHTNEMQALKEMHQEDVWRWEARQAGQLQDSTLVKPGGELARHRVWQASHFQRLLLGPDAEKVRGPAMLLTQTAELRAWRATEGVDVLGPCLQQLQEWAVQLQSQLQGDGRPRRSKAGKASARGARSSAQGGAGYSKHLPTAANAHAVPSRHRHHSKHLQDRQHRQHQEPGEQPGEFSKSPEQQVAAAVLAATGLRASAAAAAAVRALSAEPSAESFGPLVEQATDGDLSEVEQQLQALQAQVNAALIAAEERLRVVSMSPPQALMNEARPRMQLPPEPIPFSLNHGPEAAADALHAAAEGADPGLGPAAALEAEDSVQQASQRAGTFGGASTAPAPPHSEASASAGSCTAAVAVAPSLMNEDELSAAADAAATAAGLPCNPWEAADSAAAQLPPGSVPPAQAKLAYKLLTQSTAASQQEAAFDAPGSSRSADTGASGMPLQHDHRPSSGRAGLAELVGDAADGSLQACSFGSRPATQRATAHTQAADEAYGSDADAAGTDSRPDSSEGLGQQLAVDAAAGDSLDVVQGAEAGSAPSSPRSAPHSSPNRAMAASCPGRCEAGEDDAASRGEVDTAARSPHSPWQHPQQAGPLAAPRRSPSPQLSRSRRSQLFVDTEGSFLMSEAVAFRAPDAADGQQQWPAGSPQSRSDSPQRYPTPPITDLLYETTCDELVRVKDERDMLKSEVEVLRNQLKNRDNTLAMLSGQMLITPRTSAADCESLMRAAMSECSVGSMAMRSQPAVSGPPSLPGNVISLGNSANGTLAMRRAASATVNSVETSSEAVAQTQARTPQPLGSAARQQQARQQQLGSRPRSAACRAEPQAGEDSAAVSTEPSEIRADNSKMSVRAQQTTPCADVSIHQGNNSGADQATCSSSGQDNDSDACSSSYHSDGSSSDTSCCSDSPDSSSLDELIGLDDAESCLISTASCGASRKLKLPQAVKSGKRHKRSRGGSSSSDDQSSQWPPSQLAVALSALKFMLLLEVAMDEDSATQRFAGSPEGAAGGFQGPSSPLKRLKKAMEGVAAEAAAIAAGAMNPLHPAAAQQHGGQGSAARQRAAARGSGRMTTAQYGDGPLLASGVLLQLAGQSRRFDVLDATGRIAYWVEYDAVKASGSSAADGAAAAAGEGAAAGGVLSPRGSAATASSSVAPSGVAAIVGAPDGIGPAAEGIAPPKPRSKKRQEQEAEALARDRATAAAQQQLLDRLAAAHRQAARVYKDGSSLAARFAPAAPARHQKVRLRVYRVDGDAVQQLRAAAAMSGGGSSSPGRITFGGGPGSLAVAPGTLAATHSAGGSAENPKVPAVPVRAVTLEFLPRQQPWSTLRPTQRPIQTHPSLPMPRPQPLLLTNAAGGAGRGGGVADAGFTPAAVAGLPPEAAAAAAAAAAAGTGIVGPSGKLLTGASVAPRAGLVAAARVMAAREVLLQAVPRNAAYSYSVVSDQNRSGRPEDGYSMAPSSADLDSLGSESPHRSPGRQCFMSAAVGASAARLGGRQRAAGGAEAGPAGVEQWLAGSSPAGALSGSVGAACEAVSPSKSALSRSPTKRPPSGQQSSLLARAFGQ